MKLEQQAGKGSNPFKIKLVDTLGDIVSLDDVLSEGEKELLHWQHSLQNRQEG